MKALILSVSIGGGHVQAANAVKHYILKHEPNSDIQVIDTLKYINPIIDKVITGSYLNTIKITPSLFGKLYRFSETDKSIASSFNNKVNELMAYKLLPFIKDFNPDVIICTHPFPTGMVSSLKTENKLSIPLICILTDYAPHKIWLHPGVNTYIVSNSDMIDEMVKRGINRDSIKDFGIPVSPDFILKYDKRETLKELDLSYEKPTLLIMGGSLGMGKISIIYEQLSKLSYDVQMIVICGNNKKLYSRVMELKESSLRETRVLTYTKNVNKYMQACDLLITKPGGLTVTEAIISQLPLALFSPIPGQEEKNEDFLLRHNLAISLGNGSNCKKIIEDLISSPSTLESMKKNCAKFSKPTSGNDIYWVLKNLV